MCAHTLVRFCRVVPPALIGVPVAPCRTAVPD